VHRVYCKLGLNLPRRTKKRLPQRLRQALTLAAAVNAVWALDFMSNALWSGRRFRELNVLNEGVREALAIEIDTSHPAKRVIRVLDRLGELRGSPSALRMDNGPEFISQEVLEWCERHGIEPRYSQSGKPDQNAFIEPYNRTFRNEVLAPKCLPISTRCASSVPNGLGSTMNKGRTTRSEDSRRPSSERL